MTDPVGAISFPLRSRSGFTRRALKGSPAAASMGLMAVINSVVKSKPAGIVRGVAGALALAAGPESEASKLTDDSASYARQFENSVRLWVSRPAGSRKI